MTIRRLVQAASIAGVALVVMVASASATPINYNTNLSGFNGLGVNQTLFSTSGASATLLFEPTDTTAPPNGPVAPPSGINYGRFTLTCLTCTTTVGSTFAAFQFNLVVWDLTDGGLGQFIGNAPSVTVFAGSTPLQIIWDPLQLGPGAGTAPWGNSTFGTTIFSTTNPTQLIAANSGEVLGRTTVQGQISTSDVPGVPEPMTFVLIGTGLVGIGLLRRKGRKN